MPMSPKQVWRLLKESFAEWNQDKASRLAAALAYYTVFSISPLLVLVIAIAGIFFDRAAAQQQIMNQVRSLMGPQGAEFIRTALENSSQPGSNSSLIATVVSLILLIVGATGVFVQLQDALNTVWNVEERPEEGFMAMLRKRILSFGMVLVIGFLLLVSLVVSALIAGFASGLNQTLPGMDTVVQVVNFALSFGITTLLFALIYKYLPDVEIAWRDVWFGAAVTALLFSLGKLLIGIYLGQSSFGSSYGAAGSVIIVLFWVFYSTQILFLGAEITQVFSRRFGSRIRPDQHAIRQ